MSLDCSVTHTTHHPGNCGPCPDCREALADYARPEAEAIARAYWAAVKVVKR
jgi:cytidine deaminase